MAAPPLQFFADPCKMLSDVVRGRWHCQKTVGGQLPAFFPSILPGAQSFLFPRRSLWKGGTAVVTYEGLLAFCLVIIGVIGLCLTNKKK